MDDNDVRGWISSSYVLLQASFKWKIQPPVGKKKPGWLYEKKTHETWPLFCLVCLQLLWVHHHHPMKLPRMFFLVLF